MKRNVASQLISAQMIAKASGDDVTTGTCNVAVEKDGAAGTGGTATHIANGKWEYAPIQSDTDAEYLTFQFVLTNAITVMAQTYTTFPQTVDNDVLNQSNETLLLDIPTVSEFELRTILSANYALEVTVDALNNISVSDILTTQFTESYAALNTAPTLVEAVLYIQQCLAEQSVSGTVETIKKIDSSTVAATNTLDSATVPTSRTAATRVP